MHTRSRPRSATAPVAMVSRVPTALCSRVHMPRASCLQASPHRLSGVDFRPSTSGTDDGTLAAATAGLTFNSGTPRTKPVYLSSDVPPVPPLPQQYQSFNSKSSDSTLTNVYNPLLQLHPPTLTQNLSDERNYRGFGEDKDIHMEDEEMFRMEE